MHAEYERTLAVLRRIEETATPEERRTLARDIRIEDHWPPRHRAEAEAILDRIRAQGVAPPSWGHAQGVLDRIRHY